MREKIIPIALVSAVAVAFLWASPPEDEVRARIVKTAQTYLGVPYVYGAESPEAFDCSGFVQYVYSHAADLELPRNSKGMWAAGNPIEKSAVRPGDIFVFDTVGSGGPSHVAIFLGEDKMIHAISEGPKTGVVISPIADRYFAPRMIGARYFIVSPSAAPAPIAPLAPAPAPTAPPAPAPIAPAPVPSALSSEPPVDQVGFVVKSTPEVFMDKIPAATNTSIAFTITNGTGKPGVFHIFFYKADSDFSKTKILREDREPIPEGGSVEIAPYLFTEAGIYRLNVKTADNTQLMQRTWKVVDLGK